MLTADTSRRAKTYTRRAIPELCRAVSQRCRCAKQRSAKDTRSSSQSAPPSLPESSNNHAGHQAGSYGTRFIAQSGQKKARTHNRTGDSWTGERQWTWVPEVQSLSAGAYGLVREANETASFPEDKPYLSFRLRAVHLTLQFSGA